MSENPTQLPTPWHGEETEDEEDFDPMVLLPYQSPGQRAKGAIEKALVVGCGTALLAGLLEILRAYEAGTIVSQQTLVTMLTTLLINVALVGLKKYADAA